MLRRLSLCLSLICCTWGSGVSASDSYPAAEIASLRQGFASPPAAARVWVFWDWLYGNVSPEQITEDLAAMHRQGITGAMIFQVSVDPVPGADRVPEGVRFMSDPWRALFAHAVREAARLGIEIGLMASSGWNCGGPWIPAEHAGRRVVWSETKVTGPRRFAAVLPPAVPQVEGGRHVSFAPDTVVDIAVLAVPAAVTSPPVSEWQWKAGYREDDGPKGAGALAPKWLGWPAEPRADEPGIPLKSVIHLTGRLDARGRLEWDVPTGDWIVLRIAHAVGGRERQFTGPGPGGFMLDHLSAEAMDVHFQATVEKLVADVGALVGKTFTFVECDSCDLGDINWTPTFAEEFKRRRGYDIVPYLPALTGRVVAKRSVTERFLYDFRRTIADCTADNHYGRFRELCRRHGLSFMSESGGPPPVMIDALQCYSRTDVPMGEFWAENHTMSVRGAASAAHMNGCRLVAAEAFTSWQHWTQGPLEMKPYADRAFCEGMNRCLIHGFSSSPPEAGKPGYVFYAGTHFEPNITWWHQSRGLTDYLARCQYMLQQGLPVVDVCCFSGAGVPNFIPPTRGYWYELCPSLGEDYACDFASDEVLRNRIRVRDGRLELPDGMSYRLLAGPDTIGAGHPGGGRFMTPELCERIAEFLEAGATVVWPRPNLMPGLSGSPDSDAQLAAKIRDVWGPDGSPAGERRVGKGRLIWGQTPRKTLLDAGVPPDFEQQPLAPQMQRRLAYIHRRVGDTEIYFVSNRDTQNWTEAACLFRVQGRAPELWHPDSGAIVRQIIYDVVDGRTWLPLRLPPAGSVFVVFRPLADTGRIVSVTRDGKTLCASKSGDRPETSALEFVASGLLVSQPGKYDLRRADGTTVSATVAAIPAPLAVAGPWSLRFLTGPGTPGETALDRLFSWTKHDNPQVRHFSGTAAYRTEFTLPPEYVSKGSRVYLNLGVVKNLAEIRLNDRPCGLLWKHPFRGDATDALQPGKNTLEVRITNLWPNRLIGDQSLPAEERVTRSNMAVFKKDSPLLESGLLGPVMLEVARGIPVQEQQD